MRSKAESLFSAQDSGGWMLYSSLPSFILFLCTNTYIFQLVPVITVYGSNLMWKILTDGPHHCTMHAGAMRVWRFHKQTNKQNRTMITLTVTLLWTYIKMLNWNSCKNFVKQTVLISCTVFYNTAFIESFTSQTLYSHIWWTK